MANQDSFNKNLIKEVKKHEFIYNLAHPDRRKGTIAYEKWSEIAYVLGDTVKRCKYRWNSLRRRYTCEYLKISSNKDGAGYEESDWKYMDEMSFMQSYVGQDDDFLENLSKLSKRDIFCRTCLRPVANVYEQTSDCYKIFDTENFAEKLIQCTNLQVDPWDEYPHSLCKKCYTKVLDFSRFQDMCRNSLEKFNIMLENQTEVKSETNEEEITETNEDDIIETNEEEFTETNEEEITESFIDSVIEYTDVDYLLTAVESAEDNHTAPDDHDNAEYENQNEYENDAMMTEDPLEEHIKEEFVLKEEIEIDNTPEFYEPVEPECSKSLKARKRKKEQMYIEEQQIEINEEEHIESDNETDEEGTNAIQESEPDDEKPVSDGCETSGVKKKSRSRHRFQCGICSRAFLYSHRFEAHQRRHKGLPGYPCTFENCSRAYNRLEALRNHINDHNGVPNVYKCTIDDCGVVFPSTQLLYKHKLKDHKRGKEAQTYTCETCGKVLTTLRSLKGHSYLHLDTSEWPYGCDEKNCTARFRYLHHKNVHLKRHAGIKDYICPHCGMRKTTSSELSIHINLHTFEKKYPCRFCTKVFRSVGYMSTHIRQVHEGKGKKTVSSSGTVFQCSFCDRKLSSALTKKNHEMIHTGTMPYQCNECGKTFITPSLLKYHQNKHASGKNYACTECGVRYKWPGHLKTHMKIHLDGVNPYPCDICGKRFKWLSNLVSHKKLHTEGATPYTCEECGKGFRWPGSVYNHKKTHIKQKMKQNEDQVTGAVLDDL